MANKKPESLPTHLEEVDALKYEKLVLQLQSLELQKQILQQQLQALSVAWNNKYKLDEKDQVDLQSREIKRHEPEVKV